MYSGEANEDEDNAGGFWDESEGSGGQGGGSGNSRGTTSNIEIQVLLAFLVQKHLLYWYKSANTNIEQY